MELQHKIFKYVTDEYGLEKHPCSIPKNRFEDIKIDFYLWIRNKISEKLFYFIRDNIWSIKYLDENPNGYIPIVYRDKETGKCLVEFFVERKQDFYKSPLLLDDEDNNWVLSTHDGDSIIVMEIKNEKKYKEIVDDFLSKITIFAPTIREKRINRILNT